jgi:hypothetical protein
MTFTVYDDGRCAAVSRRKYPNSTRATGLVHRQGKQGPSLQVRTRCSGSCWQCHLIKSLPFILRQNNGEGRLRSAGPEKKNQRVPPILSSRCGASSNASTADRDECVGPFIPPKTSPWATEAVHRASRAIAPRYTHPEGLRLRDPRMQHAVENNVRSSGPPRMPGQADLGDEGRDSCPRGILPEAAERGHVCRLDC